MSTGRFERRGHGQTAVTNERSELARRPPPRGGGRNGEFAEHCSAPVEPDGHAGPSVERGVGGDQFAFAYFVISGAVIAA